MYSYCFFSFSYIDPIIDHSRNHKRCSPPYLVPTNPSPIGPKQRIYPPNQLASRMYREKTTVPSLPISPSYHLSCTFPLRPRSIDHRHGMHEVIGRRRSAGPANKVLDCRGTVVLGRLYNGTVAAILLSDTGHVGGELGSFDIGCCEG